MDHTLASEEPLAGYEEKAAPADELARSKTAEMLETPVAPPEYRRPKDWKPYLYPRDLKTLAREESKSHIDRARKLMSRVDKVNREGKWHAHTNAQNGSSTPNWASSSTGVHGRWRRGARITRTNGFIPIGTNFVATKNFRRDTPCTAPRNTM